MTQPVDLSGVDLNLLVLFEVVLQERHVGRAASKLHLSPSAVSHALGRLRRLLSDPLFLRTPKGVVPTARASEVAEPIAEILARVRGVVGGVQPFDPAHSSRRFTIGAPDGVAIVVLPALLQRLHGAAPNIEFGVCHLAPDKALGALLDRTADVCIAPVDPIPARVVARTLYTEDFVVAARAGHPFLKAPTLDHYCELRHVLVSVAGDAYGFVDEVLAKKGRARRIALAVPHCMMAIAALVETDMLAALPGTFVQMYGPRFGVESCAPPIPFMRSELLAITPRAAMADAGLAWLVGELEAAARAVAPARQTLSSGKGARAKARAKVPRRSDRTR